jgi:hypothetical protein
MTLFNFHLLMVVRSISLQTGDVCDLPLVRCVFVQCDIARHSEPLHTSTQRDRLVILTSRPGGVPTNISEDLEELITDHDISIFLRRKGSFEDQSKKVVWEIAFRYYIVQLSVQVR